MALAETLLLEALKLSLEERADVAAELLASLDDVPVADADEVERAWGAEIERRAHRVEALRGTRSCAAAGLDRLG